MLIGHIERLQVQLSSLKTGHSTSRKYSPEPIMSVPELVISQGGVSGTDLSGSSVPDVHHRDHPASKNRNGDNGISIGFTSHYELMRQHFDQPLADGTAGENILVATQQHYIHNDLPDRLLILTDSNEEIELVGLMVAEPCIEFTRYAMNIPPDQKPDRTLTMNLKFLRQGMRGYYARYSGNVDHIRIGDQVIIP